MKFYLIAQKLTTWKQSGGKDKKISTQSFNFILIRTRRAVSPTIRSAQITEPAITINGNPDCL
jgi:hypothetical protein